MFRHVSLAARLGALICLALGALAVLAYTSRRILADARIGGPAFTLILAERDVVQALERPTLHLLEPFAAVSTALATNDTLLARRSLDAARAARAKQAPMLNALAGRLPQGPVRSALETTVPAAADSFFDLLEQEVAPALARGDRAAAKQLVDGPVTAAYIEHSLIVEETLVLATAAAAEIQRNAVAAAHYREAQVSRWLFIAGVLVVVLGSLIALSIAWPVRRMVRTLQAVAQGDHTARLAADSGPAEFVAIGAAVNEALDAEVKALHAAQAARKHADQASRAKSDFLTNMSHELRTPMNAILGFTDLLLDTPLDEMQKDFAGTVRSAGGGLMTLINDLLDIAKIESGSLEMAQRPFAPAAVMLDVVGMLRAPAGAKGVDISGEVQSDDIATALRIIGDEGRFRQVIVNLAGNAVKFTQAGYVRLRFSCRPDPGHAEMVQLEVAVEDTGAGIAADKQALIFDRFAQADSSLGRKHGGTGLGLAISRELAERMNGSIAVQSELGVGSTFTFSARVPRAEAAPSVMTSDTAVPQTATAS